MLSGDLESELKTIATQQHLVSRGPVVRHITLRFHIQSHMHTVNTEHCLDMNMNTEGGWSWVQNYQPVLCEQL